MTRPNVPAAEVAAAAEWRAANEGLAALQEQIRKHGDAEPDDYAAAHNRVQAAAAAITIPPRLMTYRDADWPGRSADQTGLGVDALRRREQHRQAQDRWTTARGLWRGDFEELQRRQTARPARRTRKAT